MFGIKKLKKENEILRDRNERLQFENEMIRNSNSISGVIRLEAEPETTMHLRFDKKSIILIIEY